MRRSAIILLAAVLCLAVLAATAGVKDKLNAAWSTNKAMQAVFRVRAATQNAYFTLRDADVEITAIAEGIDFASVDPVIKAEAAACRQIIRDARNALEARAAFVNWKQPKGTD